jgi:hypothetical protein
MEHRPDRRHIGAELWEDPFTLVTGHWLRVPEHPQDGVDADAGLADDLPSRDTLDEHAVPDSQPLVGIAVHR